MSIDSPSSGTGGPLGCIAATVMLVATSTRSTVPLTMCCTSQSRTLGAMNTGHSRLSAATGIWLPAMPSASRGSPPKSKLPDSAMLTSLVSRPPNSLVPNSP